MEVAQNTIRFAQEVRDSYQPIEQIFVDIPGILAEDLGIGGERFTPVGGGRYRLAGTGISASDATATLTSLTDPVSGARITMDMFGSIGYATLEPGTDRREFISFTGISFNSDGSADLNSVTRGISFQTPYTASSTLRRAHAGGTILIFSNSPVLYSEFSSRSDDETITGRWTFNSPPISGTNPTTTTEVANKAYVDAQIAAGCGDAEDTTKGCVELAGGLEAASSTATYTVKTGGVSTLVLGAGLTSYGFRATTSIPVTGADGKLGLWLLATSSSAGLITWENSHIFRAASTTIAGADFNIGRTASTTFAGTANFGGPITGAILTASTTPVVVSDNFRGKTDVNAYRGGDSFCDAGFSATDLFGASGLRLEKDGSAVAANCASTIADIIASTTPVFDQNPIFTATATTTLPAANVDACYAVMGTVGGTTIGLTANDYLGFEFRNNSGASQIFAVNSGGSAQTRTQITGYDSRSSHTYSAVMRSGTAIDFYVDGVKGTTHTTNLPAGAMSNQTFMQMYYDGISGASGGRCHFQFLQGSFGR